MSNIKTWQERVAHSEALCYGFSVDNEHAMEEEIYDLRAALAERDTRLAALEKQEPIDAIAVDDMDDGTDRRYGRVLIATESCIRPMYAAAGAAPDKQWPKEQQPDGSVNEVDPGDMAAGAAPKEAP